MGRLIERSVPINENRGSGMNGDLLRTISTALGLFLLSEAAIADKLQMECGPSKGHSYTAAEGLAEKQGSGWGEDGISNGLSIFELDLETGEVAYRWRDVRDVWFDAAESATEVRLLSLDDTDLSWQVLVVFGEVTEVCSFAEILQDQPKALCVQSKNVKMLHTARTLVSDCKATLVPSE